MVQIEGKGLAWDRLKATTRRFLVLVAAGVVVVAIFYGSCTSRVLPNEYGVEQQRFGTRTGIEDHVYVPGLYFLGPGVTMHSFPRGVQVLEASNDREEARSKARNVDIRRAV